MKNANSMKDLKFYKFINISRINKLFPMAILAIFSRFFDINKGSNNWGFKFANDEDKKDFAKEVKEFKKSNK